MVGDFVTNEELNELKDKVHLNQQDIHRLNGDMNRGFQSV
jgi:hypothetical protein